MVQQQLCHSSFASSIEQLCFRTHEEQCHTISDDTVDGATEKIVEDKEEENSDAIRTSKAGLEDDEPNEGVEDSGVSNEESSAPFVNRAAVQQWRNPKKTWKSKGGSC